MVEVPLHIRLKKIGHHRKRFLRIHKMLHTLSASLTLACKGHQILPPPMQGDGSSLGRGWHLTMEASVIPVGSGPRRSYGMPRPLPPHVIGERAEWAIAPSHSFILTAYTGCLEFTGRASSNPLHARKPGSLDASMGFRQIWTLESIGLAQMMSRTWWQKH